MKRLGSLAVLCAIGLTVACGGGGPTTPSRPVVRIGVDLPLSGAEARAAEPALNGIEFFMRTHPTIQGFDLALRVADDRGDPATGAANVRSMLTDPSVVAMIGPFDSAVARQEIPIGNEDGLAMISPATSNPCLTRDVFTPALLNPERTPITCKDAGLPPASQLRPARTNNFFRLTTTDDLQGAAAGDFAARSLHLLRVAVVSDHEAYGEGLAATFSARFTSLGGNVLGHVELDPKSPPANAFLKSMKDEGAQAIYYGGGTQAPGCALRAEMEGIFPSGEATPFLGGDGIAEDPACIAAAGENSAGIFATVPIVDPSTRPDSATTIQAFRRAFGSSADYGPYTTVAYDAAAILYAAIGQAAHDAGGKPDRAAVTSLVAHTSGLLGVTGPLGFDPAGDTLNRVVSIFEATGSDLRAPWKLVGAVDYSARLPY